MILQHHKTGMYNRLWPFFRQVFEAFSSLRATHCYSCYSYSYSYIHFGHVTHICSLGPTFPLPLLLPGGHCFFSKQWRKFTCGVNVNGRCCCPGVMFKHPERVCLPPLLANNFSHDADTRESEPQLSQLRHIPTLKTLLRSCVFFQFVPLGPASAALTRSKASFSTTRHQIIGSHRHGINLIVCIYNVK